MALTLLGVLLVVMGLALLIPGGRMVVTLHRQHRRPATMMLAYWDAVGGAMAIIAGVLAALSLPLAALAFLALFLIAGLQRVRETQRSARARRQAEALEGELKQGGSATDILNRLGYWYREAGELEKAEAALKRSLELKPHASSAHVNLGNVYYDMGRPEDALDEYIRAQALDPKNDGIEHNIEMVSKKLGRRR